MVPSIIDVWGYDREFSSFSSSSSTRVTQKTEKHKLMKFCKNVGIHGPMGIVILICLYTI